MYRQLLKSGLDCHPTNRIFIKEIYHIFKKNTPFSEKINLKHRFKLNKKVQPVKQVQKNKSNFEISMCVCWDFDMGDDFGWKLQKSKNQELDSQTFWMGRPKIVSIKSKKCFEKVSFWTRQKVKIKNIFWIPNF